MTEHLDSINDIIDGDVVPREDISESPGFLDDESVIFEPEVPDPPEADELDDISPEKTKQVVSDSLRSSIEDWLDLHYHQNPTLEEACARYGVSLEDYEASDEAASEKRLPAQPARDHLSGSDVIKANDEAALAACNTDAERRYVRAHIMARHMVHDRETYQ